MSKGNTETVSGNTSIDNAPEISEKKQEPANTEDSKQELSNTEEPAQQSSNTEEPAQKLSKTEEAEPELSKMKEAKEALKENEAYEKLYTDILEHFRSFSPAEQIAGKITEEHITEYLEANREERIQQYKERREKRLIAALELFAVLGTIIATVNFLRNDPAILVNILYIIGALGAFFLWKHPRDKEDKN